MNETIQKIINMSKEEHIRYGTELADELFSTLINKYNHTKEEASEFLFNICRLFSFGDNSLGIPEKEIYNAIFKTNFSDLEFIQKLGYNKRHFRDKMIEAIKTLCEEDRFKVTCLGLCVMCVDGILSEKELYIINKINNL